ncbi:MAG: nucleotidyltransferase family protein [Leeuwenhoekiella sp.]
MDAKTNQIIIDTILPYKPKEIAVFGSYARGEMREDSDIDICVDLPETVSLLQMGGLYMDLKERLKSKIDLVTKNGINPLFKPFIEKDLVRIYEDR